MKLTPLAATVLLFVTHGALATTQGIPTINQLKQQNEQVTQLGEDAGNANTDLQRLRQMTEWTEFDQVQSTAWNMNKEEWLEYKKLMAYGPNATYYRNKPEVTPLMIMGINAKSEDERRDYAERAINIERERLSKEIAFDETWNKYIKELTPNHPIWMTEPQRRSYYKALASGHQADAKSSSPLSHMTDTRVVVYADIAHCDSTCKSFIGRYAKNSSSLARLDLFVVGSDDDEELLNFGYKVGITDTMLDEHAATINRDGGSYSRIQPAPGLPVAYRVTTAGTFKVRP